MLPKMAISAKAREDPLEFYLRALVDHEIPDLASAGCDGTRGTLATAVKMAA